MYRSKVTIFLCNYSFRCMILWWIMFWCPISVNLLVDEAIHTESRSFVIIIWFGKLTCFLITLCANVKRSCKSASLSCCSISFRYGYIFKSLRIRINDVQDICVPFRRMDILGCCVINSRTCSMFSADLAVFFCPNIFGLHLTRFLQFCSCKQSSEIHYKH